MQKMCDQNVFEIEKSISEKLQFQFPGPDNLKFCTWNFWKRTHTAQSIFDSAQISISKVPFPEIEIFQ